MADAPPTPADLEREIERLPEIRAARVVASPSGRILEIHLVSDGSKPPKQLTRDVETVAVTYGVEIDRRTISIAQMPEGVVAEGPPVVGIVLSSIAVTTEGVQISCRVRLSRLDEDAIGEASGPATAAGRARLIAAATMDAASTLLGPLVAECDSARIVEAGGHEVALVTLVRVSGDGEHTLCPGVAPVRTDRDDAVARAVIDAIGRSPGR